MRIVLILSDSSSECRKALDTFDIYTQVFSAEGKVLVVLEDLYRLEKASISLGVPLPPDTITSTKERIENKVKTLWRHVKNDEKAQVDITLVAGDLQEEVFKFVEEAKADMLLWGCQSTATLCRVVDEVNIPSLIIK